MRVDKMIEDVERDPATREIWAEPLTKTEEEIILGVLVPPCNDRQVRFWLRHLLLMVIAQRVKGRATQ